MTSDWSLRTGDGGMTVRLPDSFAADLDVQTNDGHINLAMPVTVSGRASEKRIRGKLNGGGQLLTLHTGDGSIRLDRL